MNFVFLDSTSKKYNIPFENAESWCRQLVKNANSRLKQNAKMNLPIGNNTTKIPANYRYVLSSDSITNNWLHYHYDDSLYYVVSKGKARNIYSKEVIRKYDTASDSILNIFVLPHHADSIASRTYRPHTSGVSLGNKIKITGPVHDGMKPWKMATNLNHEVGHSFGLSHSWYKNDGCEDTPPHPNCWAPSKTNSKCKDKVSNNMMDYNNSQMAITPCQLGKINLMMSDINTPRRKLLIKTWCKLDTQHTITIKDSVSWKGYKDIHNNIVVEPKGKLTICCRTSMPEGSSITIKPGGELILLSARLHNDCNLLWKGIIIESKGGTSGKLTKVGEVNIENVAWDEHHKDL